MNITSSVVNQAGIEYLAIETINNNGAIPAVLKSQMTPAVRKAVERKVKFFKKNKEELDKAVEAQNAAMKPMESEGKVDAATAQAPVESAKSDETAAETAEEPGTAEILD